MIRVEESRLLLSIGLNKGCVKRITLGPDFIARALRDPGPAYSLKLLKEEAPVRDYRRLSDNMKLHLHVKQLVADELGAEFGGKLDCFKWSLV